MTERPDRKVLDAAHKLLSRAGGTGPNRNGDGDPLPPRVTFRDIPDPFVLPRLAWHASGLLVRPTHGEVAGPEKSLKSVIATAIGVGLALGEPVLGRFEVPERQRVSFLTGEGGEAMFLRRLERIANAYGHDVSDLRGWLQYDVATGSVLALAGDVGRHLDAFRPAVLFLDPWYAYAPGEVDARNLYEQGIALRAAQAITEEHGASLLLVNHFNQSGNGMGLRRITMAGHAEWADSWLLVDHRETPDVANGRFMLKVAAGSRQWGGSEWNLDVNLGRFDHELGAHDGGITWRLGRTTETTDPGDIEVAKVTEAKLALLRTWKKKRSPDPLTKTEWIQRTTGTRASYLRAAFAEMVEAGDILETSIDVEDASGRRRSVAGYVVPEYEEAVTALGDTVTARVVHFPAGAKNVKDGEVGMDGIGRHYVYRARTP